MPLAPRCLLQPPHHPMPCALHRACPHEPQPLPFVASLDLAVPGTRSHRGCPQPSPELACLPAQFPSLSFRTGPARGLEAHNPAAAKGKGREESYKGGRWPQPESAPSRG
uniref:Uncharacterized protein n=1 Tax=Mus spicilegus TaxID=10103 RepID=A0A8C6GXP5_MUSSI